MQNLFFIGDIHSQHLRLSNALEYIYEKYTDYHIVFLGDIFDSRMESEELDAPPYSDPLEVYILVKSLVDSGSATLLQSNHQDKLKRWLGHELTSLTNPIKTTWGLNNTIRDLVAYVDNEKLYAWLSDLPYYFVGECNGKVYKAAHAYYSDKFLLNEELTPHQKQLAIYGIQEKGHRVEWWLQPRNHEYIQVAGHYHVLMSKKGNVVMLDDNCGSPNGKLAVYNAAENDITLF